MKLKRVLFSLVTILAASSMYAASSDTQNVYAVMGTLNEILFDENSLQITVSTLTNPGDGTAEGTGVTYVDISSNEASTTTKKITGQVDALGVSGTLKGNLDAPAGSSGTSAGLITFATTATDMVTTMTTDFSDENTHLGYTYDNVDPTTPTGTHLDTFIVTLSIVDA